MALTKQDIWRAADELDAEGNRPTLSAVRNWLGSGSFTTISEAMSEWKKRRKPVVSSLEPAPEAVVDRLTDAAGAVWTLALAEAAKRLDDDRKQLEVEMQSLTERSAEAAELADTLAHENDALRARLDERDALASDRDRLAAQLTEVTRRSAEDLARSAEKAARLEAEAAASRQEAKDATGRAANLEGQVAAVKGQFDELAAERVRVEAERQATAERADALREENAALREQLRDHDALVKAHEKLAGQLADVKRRSSEELARCIEKANKRDTEAMEARKAMRQAIERAANLGGQVTALKGQLAELMGDLRGSGHR